MTHLRLFLRAFAIVTVTACNVVLLQRGNVVPMFCTGGLLSWIWFTNTRTAAHTDRKWAREAYALGAAVGTVTGWAIAGLL